MIYETWYQGSWWLFALFMALCAAVVWRWISRLNWPWQMLILGLAIIAFGFPAHVAEPVSYWAPAFIQAGFEFIDSGIASAWPIYRNAVIAMLLWAALCLGLAFWQVKRDTK